MNRNTKLTILFGSFVFLQFTVLGLANHAGEGYLPVGQRELVYYMLQVFVILGFCLHGFFPLLTGNSRIRTGIAYAVFGLFAVCAAVMLLTGSDSVFYLIVTMAGVLCLGVIGGAANHRMSLECASGAEAARCMGIGSAAAAALQYLLQIQWGVTPVLPLFMLAAFLLLIYLLSGTSEETEQKEAGKQENMSPYRLVLAIVIVASFLLFVCFFNGYIHHLQIQSGYEGANAYSWPRLMMVPCYLLFAAIGDRRGGKYVPITALCVTLVALLNVVLVGTPGTWWLNMCLFYCAVAAITSYYLLTFWRLAPGTKHPALWAPFGRILDSTMVLVTGAIQISSIPGPVILGIDIAGVALIIVLMAVSGDFSFAEPAAPETGKLSAQPSMPAAPETSVPAGMPETGKLPVRASMSGVPETSVSDGVPVELVRPAAPSMLSAEDTLERMREEYALTRRETEVLSELVLTEDKQSVISERLSIQVKTLQDYVTRLYRKTGAKTRSGLTELFHKTRIDDAAV